MDVHSNSASLVHYLPLNIIRRTPELFAPTFPFASPVPTVLTLLELDEGSLDVPTAIGLGNAEADPTPYLVDGCLRPLATSALACTGAVVLIFVAATIGTRLGPTIPPAVSPL